MKTFAVKCEKTVTFYVNVQAENEWQAQHKAEYEERENDIEFVGYNRSMSDVRTIHAVEVDDADS